MPTCSLVSLVPLFQKLALNKAPGPGFISAEHLLYAGESLLFFLVYYLMCIVHGILPSTVYLMCVRLMQNRMELFSTAAKLKRLATFFAAQYWYRSCL